MPRPLGLKVTSKALAKRYCMRLRNVAFTSVSANYFVKGKMICDKLNKVKHTRIQLYKNDPR